MQRRLATIMAADVAGYSRLMAADEEGVVARLRAARSAVIDPALAEVGGRIVKTMGDGLLIEFASPVEAVRAALAIQTAMNEAEESRPAEDRMLFRVGVHFGDVMVDGDDLLGDVVNVAARLETLAPVGGLCVSRGVRDMISGKVDAELTDLGPQMVKNIPEPVEVWRVQVAGALAATPDRAEKPSIAVLPFANRSPEVEDAFLADGIVEDVTNDLGRFRTLTVVARASAQTFRDDRPDAAAIGRALGARYLVEGSVRRAGERLRVSAQLIEAETDVQIWSERWDRATEDIFELQDDLTRAIVGAVEPELGAHERTLARRKPTGSLTSWELCQRGHAEHQKHTKESQDLAEALFRQAVAADPDFAMPHAMLGRLGWVRVASGWSDDPVADVRAAIVDAKRAVELDDREEWAHLTLGVLLAIAGDAEAGMAAVETALALNPNNTQCHHAVSMVCLYQQEPDGVLMRSAAETALKLSLRDPRATMLHLWVGLGEWIENDGAPTPNAIAAFESSCRYTNAPWFVFMICATSLFRSGDMEQARKRLEEAMRRHPPLTLEVYRTALSFPAWPDWLDRDKEALQAFVDLGLPIE